MRITSSRSARVALALAAWLAAAGALADDRFAGRYRSASGGDHDLLVVTPEPPGRWLLALQRYGHAPLQHGAGALIEATAQRIAHWFGDDAAGTFHCLAPSDVQAAPILCSVPAGSTVRLRSSAGADRPALTAHTGWLLVVAAGSGNAVAELIKD